MKKYHLILSIIATSLATFSLNAETKISRVTHMNTQTYGGQLYPDGNTSLEYDSDGRLVRFFEYYSDRHDNPQFDIRMEWNQGKVTFTGLIDYHTCHGEIALNSDGLATHFTCAGGEEADITFTYDGKRLATMYYPESGRHISFQYEDGKLMRIDNPSYSSGPIQVSYDKLIPCHIPHPILIHNLLYYYRFIAYADLLGQTFDYFPTSYNRYGKGWKPLQTTLNDDGEVTSIIAPEGGFTHSVHECEQFLYEHTTTNSVKEVSYDLPVLSVDNGLVTISGKNPDTVTEVYDPLGHLVKTTTADTFRIDGKGLFIIKTGPHTSKIHIR